MNTYELKAQLVLQGKNISDYSEALGISRSALYRKMNGKTDFNRTEIQKTIDFLGISNDIAMRIFFAQ